MSSKRYITFIALSALVVTAPAIAKKPKVLEELSIRLEVNETDQDAEIVLITKTDVGLKSLKARDPDGFKILQVRSKDREKLGLAEIAIESAEPEIAAVLDAYPVGKYSVRAKTYSGKRLKGSAVLSHDLLPAPTFSPSAGETVDSTVDLVITWTPVAGATAYIIEVEQDDLDVSITAKLDASNTSYTIPATFLVPDTEYEVGMGTQASNGNLAFAEGNFKTLP